MLDTKTKYTPEDLLGMRISGYSPDETETIIDIRGDEDYATLCISDNMMLTNIKKLVKTAKDSIIVDGICKNGTKITEVRIRLQKDLILFGPQKKKVVRQKREMTEEEKAAVAERLRKARAAKVTKNQE